MLVKGISKVAPTRTLRKCALVPICRQMTTSKNACRCGSIKCFCGAVENSTITKPYFQPRSTLSTVEGKIDPLESILQNNRNWVNKTQETDPHFFEVAGSVHKPKYLYFGCSDARVPANLILGLGPGEVFVHRNVGNLVPVNDLNALSCLEYAVGHLGVTDIIVAGHYDCGAVKGATSKETLGLLDTWLRLIKDVYRLHKDHLDMIENLEEKQKRLVELNVVEQCLNLYKTHVVQQKRYETSLEFGEEGVFPRIHGMVFNPRQGLMKSLKTDIWKRAEELNSIYKFNKE